MTRPLVAVIGATGGIGAAICRYIVERGGRVIPVGRNPSRLQQISHEFGAQCAAPVACDLAAVHDATTVVATILRREPSCSAMVYSAGVGVATGGLEPVDTAAMTAVNFAALLHVARAYASECLNRMRRGAFVAISSRAALAPTHGGGYYASTKIAAEVALSEIRTSLRVASNRTQVCVVRPGLVRTELARQFLLSTVPARADALLAQALAPADVAAVVWRVLHDLPAGVELRDVTICSDEAL